MAKLENFPINAICAKSYAKKVEGQIVKVCCQCSLNSRIHIILNCTQEPVLALQ